MAGGFFLAKCRCSSKHGGLLISAVVRENVNSFVVLFLVRPRLLSQSMAQCLIHLARLDQLPCIWKNAFSQKLLRDKDSNTDGRATVKFFPHQGVLWRACGLLTEKNNHHNILTSQFRACSESSKAELNAPELARSYDADAMELCPDLDLHKPAIDLHGRQELVLARACPNLTINQLSRTAFSIFSVLLTC